MGVVTYPEARLKMLYPNIMNMGIVAQVIHKTFVNRILVVARAQHGVHINMAEIQFALNTEGDTARGGIGVGKLDIGIPNTRAHDGEILNHVAGRTNHPHVVEVKSTRGNVQRFSSSARLSHSGIKRTQVVIAIVRHCTKISG